MHPTGDPSIVGLMGVSLRALLQLLSNLMQPVEVWNDLCLEKWIQYLNART